MVDLGVLTHYKESEADSINNANQVLLTCTVIGERPDCAFLWHNGKLFGMDKDLDVLALNDKGYLIGIKTVDVIKATGVAFLWRNGRMEYLGQIDSGGISPCAINNSGQIAGIVMKGDSGIAAMWDKGRVKVLPGPPDALQSCALCINATGQVAGSVVYADKSWHAHLWQNEESTPIGTLPMCTQSEAHDINDKGQIVCWAYGSGGWDTGNGDLRSFIWKNGTTTDLGTLEGGNRTKAFGINNKGQIVGRACVRNGATRAFLWESGQMTNLGTLPGGNYSSAVSINDKGWIVGSATTARGSEHAILWRPAKHASR